MKKSFAFLFLLYFYTPGHAQIITSKDQDQNNLSTSIAERFNSDSLAFIEKVYLHTDRTYYYTGDDIWFKAYLIEAENNLLTNQSNNLHVELISPASKIISSRIIRLEDGLGNGDFKLTDDMRSGRYRLRAYTNYMRNFSDELFFIKDIIVINSKDNSEESSNIVKYVDKKIQISFFPEGGSMVDNVSSIVAFKAVDEKDKGCEISGKIFSSTGDLITEFKSVHNGMGSFFLRPYPGLSYYSIIKGSDSIEFKTDLPKSFSEGVTISTSINDENELVVNTKTNPQTLPLILERDLILSFSARKKIIKTMSYRIKSPTTSFVTPTDDLPEGIIMATLSASDVLPLSERLIYIQKDTPVNIKIESDKMIYNKREQVALNISLSGDSTIERDGNISLAVADKNMTENSSIFPRNISSWFLLESDVRGYVEDPSYYFDPSNSERLKYLDLLLRTQGWRDFVWKYDSTYYPKETGFTISGRLRKNYTNKTIEDSKVNIGIFESKNTITTTIPVDSSGRFIFSGIYLTGEARVIVTGIGKKNHLKGLLVMDSVHYIPAKTPLIQPIITIISETKLSSLKSYYEINESVRKKYKLSDTIGLGEVRIIAEKIKNIQTIKVESSRSVYGIPDDEVIITQQMDSYSNPFEILKGRLPGVLVTGVFPFYKITIRGIHSISGSSMPLFLVDGFQTYYDDLISMPGYFIDRIDVLKSAGATAMYGMKGTNGVINIITRTSDRVSEYLPVDYSVNIKINGYNAPRLFYSPQHLPNIESSFEPDFRSTLYWKPNIGLNNKNKVVVKFYNSDNSSIIKVIAEGITTTGIPVTGQAEYEVR